MMNISKALIVLIALSGGPLFAQDAKQDYMKFVDQDRENKTQARAIQFEQLSAQAIERFETENNISLEAVVWERIVDQSTSRATSKMMYLGYASGPNNEACKINMAGYDTYLSVRINLPILEFFQIDVDRPWVRGDINQHNNRPGRIVSVVGICETGKTTSLNDAESDVQIPIEYYDTATIVEFINTGRISK